METPAVRRRTMQAVKSKNTAPELFLRKILHARGYRYRIHRRDLAGCPDLVFPSRRKVIFVHGCFWHGHDCPRGSRLPKSNLEYWGPKIARNRTRDKTNLTSLQAAGWKVCEVWECQLKEETGLLDKLQFFLEAP
jgi:DNA mismatch endonuclease (patch repair protein)